MVSEWQYSTIHNSPCKVIEEQALWGQTTCRVWLPTRDAVVKVPQKSLQPLSVDLQPEIEADRIVYVAVRRKAIERVGLAEVRNYRLANLEKEEKEWRQGMETARQIIPEIRPLLLLGISGESSS